MTKPNVVTSTEHDALLVTAKALKLHGLVENWDALNDADFDLLKNWLGWEAHTRQCRGLTRRLAQAKLGKFKPMVDFDWAWPKQCDKGAISDLMQVEFIAEATNVILMGPNGIGKTMVAQNITYAAVMQGHTGLFVTASQMLNDLAAQESDNALRRRLKYYAQPQLLVIDEVGYLSYGTRHADLLFEVISRRYEVKATIVTTNKPFAEWNAVFPNAACVTSLVDRLVHHSEIIVLEGDSYRAKEAKAKAASTQRRRKQAKVKT
ncbi:MAG: IS21-like element helper ATPase IstB [Pseudomonadales bacterium]|nr:IS21-like element helper ATPase IstB [Pseudomonadales bacterium]